MSSRSAIENSINVIDNSRVMQFVNYLSLTIVTYNRNMFIVQATRQESALENFVVLIDANIINALVTNF
jgi:hypothetical protein